MLRLLLISLLLAVSSCLKAVQFGESKSAATLFQPTPSVSANTEILYHNSSHQVGFSVETSTSGEEVDTQPELFDDGVPEGESEMDSHFHNKDGDDWGLFVPIDLKGETTVVRRAVAFEKRARGVFAGTVQMDCVRNPEVCRNAGFYQNCLMKAYGDPTKVRYRNGPKSSDDNHASQNEQRKRSGVTTKPYAPCKSWPFAQRFWNMLDATQNLKNGEIQTDEWPMAIMDAVYGPVRPAPQMSLRCMHNRDNSRGGNGVQYFRTGTWRYRNIWKHHRTYAPDVEIKLHDWYNVDFDFSGFPSTRAQNPKLWDARQGSLQWADPTPKNWRSVCKQYDMRQFQLNRRNGGSISAPYDIARDNTYRINGADKDIDQFHLILRITGSAKDQVEARIWHMFDGKQETLATTKSPKTVKPGQSIILAPNSSKMSKALTIKRSTTGKTKYEFEYSTSTDQPRYFKFNTEDEGNDPTGIEPYCTETCKSSVITIECSFPGW